MATKKIHSLQDKYLNIEGSNYRFGIVVSNFNHDITSKLLSGSTNTLIQHGVKEKNIIIKEVPGAFELVFAAKKMAEERVHAIICLGSVIQGETKHFDYICQAVSQGIKDLNIILDIPIIFGVLTDDNIKQAIDRSGGKYGNKGVDVAITAIHMAKLNS
tara:strand:+ start:444 stop:920 length:477 start_codon:yes stop_codon:yes gene_type:complete